MKILVLSLFCFSTFIDLPNKIEHEFTTPSNDILAASYDTLYAATYDATHDRDLGQHI